jgi:hypothetical protein
MAGRLVADGGDVCFVPRFAFVAATAYVVAVDGDPVATLVRPSAGDGRPPTATVLGIHPSGPVVPRNLLRTSVRFSAPMGVGWAATHVRLVDDGGDELVGALLPTEHELWDADRRRLTVLLDPARIKRGLAPHREVGYPLEVGTEVRVVVDAAFRDATGVPLRAGAEHRWRVGPDERRHVEPAAWALREPRAGTTDAVVATFDRPLDHALLGDCLLVLGPDGRPVAGTATVGPEERSWRWDPGAPWVAGPHHLVVDAVLEDLAGNSVRRVFDRDLARREDHPRGDGPVARPFRVS